MLPLFDTVKKISNLYTHYIFHLPIPTKIFLVGFRTCLKYASRTLKAKLFWKKVYIFHEIFSGFLLLREKSAYVPSQQFWKMSCGRGDRLFFTFHNPQNTNLRCYKKVCMYKIFLLPDFDETLGYHWYYGRIELIKFWDSSAPRKGFKGGSNFVKIQKKNPDYRFWWNLVRWCITMNIRHIQIFNLIESFSEEWGWKTSLMVNFIEFLFPEITNILGSPFLKISLRWGTKFFSISYYPPPRKPKITMAQETYEMAYTQDQPYL